jgi:hypothetical protein
MVSGIAESVIYFYRVSPLDLSSNNGRFIISYMLIIGKQEIKEQQKPVDNIVICSASTFADNKSVEGACQGI